MDSGERCDITSKQRAACDREDENKQCAENVRGNKFVAQNAMIRPSKALRHKASQKEPTCNEKKNKDLPKPMYAEHTTPRPTQNVQGEVRRGCMRQEVWDRTARTRLGREDGGRSVRL